MSRSRPFDSHAARDLNPRRRLADAEQSLTDLLRDAAALLTDPSLPRSSTRDRCAGKLRAMARQLTAAQRAEAAFRGGR
jgi:hypothetical protein